MRSALIQGMPCIRPHPIPSSARTLAASKCASPPTPLPAAGIRGGAPGRAEAVISGAGNCTGNGYSVQRSAGKPANINAAKTASAAGGTTVDFKTQTDWFVASYKDYLAGRGESPTGSMSSGFANVVFFGIHLPVIGGTGHGTTGQGGPISAADVLPGPLSGHAVASVLVAYGV